MQSLGAEASKANLRPIRAALGNALRSRDPRLEETSFSPQNRGPRPHRAMFVERWLLRRDVLRHAPRLLLVPSQATSAETCIWPVASIWPLAGRHMACAEGRHDADAPGGRQRAADA